MGEGGVFVFVESLQNLFYGLTIVLFNLCETVSLINPSSTYRIKSIGLPVLSSYLVNMESKAKLNLEYIEIDPTLLQNPENLLKPDWIANSGIKFSE